MRLTCLRLQFAACSNEPIRLDQLHRELDDADCDAYGWDYAILEDEEEMLLRRLALKFERAPS